MTNIDQMKALFIMMIFIYKFDQKEYLTKYKAKLIVPDNLQHIEQDIYAVILTVRIFCVLMTIVIAFDLETRQFDVINVFVNSSINKIQYCRFLEK